MGCGIQVERESLSHFELRGLHLSAEIALSVCPVRNLCDGEWGLGRGGGRAYSFLFLSVLCKHMVYLFMRLPHILNLKKDYSSFHLYILFYVVIWISLFVVT